MKKLTPLLASFAVLMLLQQCLHAQTRDEKVKNDKERIEKDASWFYDDLESAIAAARKEKKPLMVVLRCIP